MCVDRLRRCVTTSDFADTMGGRSKCISAIEREQKQRKKRSGELERERSTASEIFRYDALEGEVAAHGYMGLSFVTSGNSCWQEQT